MSKKGETSLGFILGIVIAVVAVLLIIFWQAGTFGKIDPGQFDIAQSIVQANCEYTALIEGNSVCLNKLKSSSNVYFTCGYAVGVEGLTFEGSGDVKKLCFDGGKLANFTKTVCNRILLDDFDNEKEGKFAKVYVNTKKCVDVLGVAIPAAASATTAKTHDWKNSEQCEGIGDKKVDNTVCADLPAKSISTLICCETTATS